MKLSPSRKRGELQRDVVSVPELRREVDEQKREVADEKRRTDARFAEVTIGVEGLGEK